MWLLRILGNMRPLQSNAPARPFRRNGGLCAAAIGVLLSTGAGAQSCTTQAKMTSQQRSEVGTAAYDLAAAILAGDTAKVRAAAVSQYAGDPNQTAYLLRSTGEKIAGDTLAVSQAYLLDASSRKAGDTSEADFACPLTGTVAETDFGIAGLPPGRFAFAMVEAQGASPWLLSFLLQQENGSWKMAGFYPHPRAAGGHDGLWYWTSARADAKANKPWLAWVLYGAADQLLRPASFVSSGNLDKLRNEQRTAAPEPLTNGLSAESPISVSGPDGSVFRISELRAQPSDDGKALNLYLRAQGAPATSSDASTHGVQAARALLTAHPELREGFTNVWIVSELSGGSPVTVQRPVQDIVAGSK